jgi:hypothetical protein
MSSRRALPAVSFPPLTGYGRPPVVGPVTFSDLVNAVRNENAISSSGVMNGLGAATAEDVPLYTAVDPFLPCLS